MSTRPVIVAVDGSEDALRALWWARDAALLRSAPLRLVHVRQYAAWGQPEVLVAEALEPPEDLLLAEVRRTVEERTDPAGPPDTEYVSLIGVPGALLPELGAEAQLLVLGSRGRGGFASLLLGSNGMAAARDADCPVVVVTRPGRKAHGEAPPRPGPRIVVGVSPDAPDGNTLAFAFEEAARRGAALDVVAAYPWPGYAWTAAGDFTPTAAEQREAQRATEEEVAGAVRPHGERRPEVAYQVLVAPGDAAGHVVEASRGAELVVVGRHRRRRLSPTRLLGSVTHAVLLHAVSPVAVVPPAVPEPGPEAVAEGHNGQSATGS
ncbi:universal stress protein [Streptomyces sp. NPDC058045]|uniref:universal stress protein n=1 Tax=Streptomyces sp. NPDC058045 TaxID=3346311 RepID=UPI0036ECECC1